MDGQQMDKCPSRHSCWIKQHHSTPTRHMFTYSWLDIYNFWCLRHHWLCWDLGVILDLLDLLKI